jgi:hypothetical protein
MRYEEAVGIQTAFQVNRIIQSAVLIENMSS